MKLLSKVVLKCDLGPARRLKDNKKIRTATEKNNFACLHRDCV